MTLWLLGGLDPTGGAGVLRDFVTASVVAGSQPVHCVITAWTRQGTGSPAVSEPLGRSRFHWQLRELPPPKAVKIGLLPAVLVDPLIEILHGIGAPVVLDPVLDASDGGALGSTADSLSRLIPRVLLVTPNAVEAAAFTGSSPEDPELARALAERFPGVAFLLKGGHAGGGNRVVDHLRVGEERHELVRPRWPGADPRGTGCALATAIACGLAAGREIPDAVRKAVEWLGAARRRATQRGGTVHLTVR